MARHRNPIRRSQAIVPFGVGAMHDFPNNQSLMATGLDVWPKSPVCRLDEDRLARRLGIRFFRQPPPAPGGEGRQGAFLPFVRFPLVHQCPRCGSLKRAEWNRPRPPRCNSDIIPRFRGKPCAALPERRRWRMVPIRFIVACPKGCIDDFPWEIWAHSKGKKSLNEVRPCPTPKLRIYSSGKVGLIGVVVKCEGCGSSRSLMGAARPDSLTGLQCTGNRPWFGPEGKVDCENPVPPRLVQRGASNIYFAKVASSILIPPYSDPIRKYVDDEFFWSKIVSGRTEGSEIDEGRISILGEAWNVDAAKLIEAAKAKLAGIAAADDARGEQEYRYEEYKALVSAQTSSEGEFITKPMILDGYEKVVRDYFSNIVLVEKLAETRALTGFSRLNPPPFREYDREDQKLLWRRPEPWLPAIRVYGEGVFLELRSDVLDRWRAGSAMDRYRKVQENLDAINSRLGRTRRELSPDFFLLHTLAHVLIRRLSFECGYGSASLRERIYCLPSGPTRMSGILLYTAAGDSEGTMGGLVLQGKSGRLERVLVGALEDAAWCSSDPVCIESPGQGTDSLNLAACHACCLLPETSCEEGNRFLDRAALVGLQENPDFGLFGSTIEEVVATAGGSLQ